MSQKQDKQIKTSYTFMSTYHVCTLHILVMVICSPLAKAVKTDLDDVMGAVQSQRQEDNLCVDLVTHGKVSAVCTWLLITRAYGHVSGRRSRILLQID